MKKMNSYFLITLMVLMFSAPAFASMIKKGVEPSKSEIATPMNIGKTGTEEANNDIAKETISSMGIYYNRKKIAKMIGSTRKVLLTFDDGPNPRTTPKVLEILRKRNIKAIFFVIGLQVKKYPKILKQIADAGHIIGNHTYDHKNLAKLTKEQIEYEVNHTNELIESITGKKVKYLRPPYGALNKAAISFIRREGMSIMLWNIDPNDWKNRNKYKTLQNLQNQLRIGKAHERGGVVLMHDIYSSTVNALGPFLDELAENNYLITSIDKVSQDSNNMWASCSPAISDSAFRTEFKIKNSGNQILTVMLKPKRKKKISAFAMLKAKKTGNLIEYMFSENL